VSDSDSVSPETDSDSDSGSETGERLISGKVDKFSMFDRDLDCVCDTDRDTSVCDAIGDAIGEDRDEFAREDDEEPVVMSFRVRSTMC